ncbi:DUF551 domain-containing protein [Enterobacter hormaechei]|uniref:DUF551 domain-containing protein n=1 Tax=Enterobacter hormaechei TaxID=158836 RepID=UPI002892D881|nr:DUF551 domain-containing protein [Enterobacter hormaechei]WMA77333.1 DUF551 domain-containing protein [Enterobacter hormaechei]WMA82039.1 DUF551 domain-containing protein [Enterobacter hormaechei]
MSTFTKEQLIEKLQHRISVASGFPESEKAQMDLELARIALASLEAEPAIHRWRRVTAEPYGPYPWHYGDFICFSKPVDGIEDEYYYAAPPAPVSVPDDVLKGLLPDAEKAEFWFEHNGKILFEGVKFNNAVFDACRAAMLQGAEPVTTAYKLPFEQWLSQQTGTIDVECGCVMTEVFFHWLRVAYEAGNSPVTPGGWVACSERMPVDFETVLVCQDGGVIFCAEYEDGDFYPDEFPNVPKQGCEITHWMPLPAAPQQEVK